MLQTTYTPFSYAEAELLLNSKVKEVSSSCCSIITSVTRHAFYIGCELVPFERAVKEYITESGEPLGKIAIINKYR